MGRWKAAVAVFATAFAIAFAAFLAVYLRYPALQDTDSYYHLAVAREIAQHGLPESLPWARMTAMNESFGDLVYLFHLGLAPFAAGEQPERGALVALAALDGAIFGLLATLGFAAIGRWGALLPLVVFLGSTEALFRLTRLRPEHGALLLLLVAAGLIGRGAYRSVGLVAALYALAYSAVHAFAGLAVAAFLLIGWRTRRWPWALPLYAIGGLGLGIVLHPRFPGNLPLLIDQARVGLGGSALAGSGAELGPHSTLVAVLTHLGLALAALVVWQARRPAQSSGGSSSAAPSDRDLQTRDVMLLFATAFLLLYALAARFVSFGVAFGGLALLWSLRARGEVVGARFACLGRQLPTGLGLGVAALLALPPLAIQVPRFAAKATLGPADLRNEERRAVAAKLPDGARVAATWGLADLFSFFAPQARYLEVLDPIFMQSHSPRAAAASRRVFDGVEPDVPFTVGTDLDSDYLLTSRFSSEPGGATLLRQLLADPRVDILHDRIYFLARWVPGRNQGFALNWVAAPEPASAWGSETAPTTSPGAVTVPYPRPNDRRARALEGYVDLRRLPVDSPCLALHTPVSLPPKGERVTWRFAATGPAELWWNGTLLVRTQSAGLARLDEVVEGTLRATPAGPPHDVSVRSCGPATGSSPEPRGFFLHLTVGAG